MSHMARIGFSLIWLICFNTCNHRDWFHRLLFLFCCMFEQSQSMADRLALFQCCWLYIGVSLSLLGGTSIDLCSPAELNWLNKRDCLDRGGGRGHKSGLGDTCCWRSICAHIYTTHPSEEVFAQVRILHFYMRMWKCLLRFSAFVYGSLSTHSDSSQRWAPVLGHVFPPCVWSMFVCTDSYLSSQKTQMMKSGGCRPGLDLESVLCVCVWGPNTCVMILWKPPSMLFGTLWVWSTLQFSL